MLLIALLSTNYSIPLHIYNAYKESLFYKLVYVGFLRGLIDERRLQAWWRVKA